MQQELHRYAWQQQQQLPFAAAPAEANFPASACPDAAGTHLSIAAVHFLNAEWTAHAF